MAEIVIQETHGRWPYRARLPSPVEVDYHDGLGRFGIEAVADDGRIVILYLSMIEACGLSAALRSEIAYANDVVTDRYR